MHIFICNVFLEGRRSNKYNIGKLFFSTLEDTVLFRQVNMIISWRQYAKKTDFPVIRNLRAKKKKTDISTAHRTSF
jgi:hypothetical protein